MPGASDVIGLVGRSGSAAGDRPWKIMGDGSIAQLTAGEYPNPLTGAINGADVFFFRRTDDTIGLFCGDNATIGANVAHDGFLTTSVPTLTSYSTATIAAAKNAAQMGGIFDVSKWAVLPLGLRGSKTALYLGHSDATTSTQLDSIARSTDNGATFSDTAVAGGAAGGTTKCIIADAGGFVFVANGSPGPFTYVAAGGMYASFDYGATLTNITNVPAGNPIMGATGEGTSTYGMSFGVAYDSANSRLIMVACQRPSPVGAGNHCIFTLPSGSLGSAWTNAKTNFVAQGTGIASACSAVYIFDSYVYVCYKRATDDADCHLYRALLSDLTTWTDVATLTSCTAGSPTMEKLADGKLYACAGGSGVWTSADGSAASWSRILTSGSAYNLCKVRD